MQKDYQSKSTGPGLKIILILIASAGLLLTILPSFLNWQGITGPEQVNKLMMAGTILWFASAGFLFVKKDPD